MYISLRGLQFFFQAVWGLEKELLPSAEGKIILLIFQAYQYIQELKQRVPTVHLQLFINSTTLQQIRDALGTSLQHQHAEEETNSVRDSSEISDEVREEIYDESAQQGMRQSFAFR